MPAADKPVITELQTRIDTVLEQMRLTTECLQLSTEVLFILNGKRETLEEKTIKEIFHQLDQVLCRYLEKLHKHCLVKTFPTPERTEAASKVLDEIRLSVSELLKIARYDLNFLEQYFEYDYCAKLHSQCRFVERVESFLQDESV